jgi:hypothetical protein
MSVPVSNFDEIVSILKHERPLLFPRDILGDMVYDVSVYLLDTKQEINTLIDSNVLSYIADLVSGKVLTSDGCWQPYRTTAALMAFFISMKIKIDPGHALQEYYQRNNFDQTSKRLSLFRQGDNLDPQVWADLATGKRDRIEQGELPNVPLSVVSEEDLARKVRFVEVNKVPLMKGLVFKHSTQNAASAMVALLEWIETEYLITAPSLYFIGLWLSPKRMKEMIKGSELADIENAAWDLSILQHLISEEEQNENTSKVTLLSTFDKAVRKTAELIFEDVSREGIVCAFVEMWGKDDGEKVAEKILRIRNGRTGEEPVYSSSAYHVMLREKVTREFQDRFCPMEK